MVDNALVLLRWANLIVWASVAVYLAPSFWRSMTSQARTLDPIWGAIWFLATNRISFSIITLYAPESWGSILCYSFALAGAGMLVILRRTYGRHP